MLAAAAVLMVVLGLAALRGIGGGPGARTDAPPRPDRVIAFQRGVDWQASAGPGDSNQERKDVIR